VQNSKLEEEEVMKVKLRKLRFKGLALMLPMFLFVACGDSDDYEGRSVDTTTLDSPIVRNEIQSNTQSNVPTQTNVIDAPVQTIPMGTVNLAIQHSMHPSHSIHQFVHNSSGAWLVFTTDQDVRDFQIYRIYWHDDGNDVWGFPDGTIYYESGVVTAGLPVFVQTLSHSETFPTLGVSFTDNINNSHVFWFSESSMYGELQLIKLEGLLNGRDFGIYTQAHEAPTFISSATYFFNNTFSSRRGSAATGFDIFVSGDGAAYLRNGGNGRITRVMDDARSVHAVGWGGFSPNLTTFFVLTSANDLYAWGYNASGLVGDDTGLDRPSTEPFLVMQNVANIYFQSPASTTPTIFALKLDGSRWSWGNGAFHPVMIDWCYNANQYLRENHITTLFGNPEIHPMIDLPHYIIDALGGRNNIVSSVENVTRNTSNIITSRRNFALTQDGVLWGWGDNYGHLGDGTRAPRTMPVQIAENVRRITESYFITNDNNWYHYSGSNHMPIQRFQDVRYAFGDSSWFSNGGQLLTTGRSGPNIFIDNIMPPSIVHHSN